MAWIPGGSFLMGSNDFYPEENYCLRYRPAARRAQAVETSTGHIGFRCVVRGNAPD